MQSLEEVSYILCERHRIIDDDTRVIISSNIQNAHLVAFPGGNSELDHRNVLILIVIMRRVPSDNGLNGYRAEIIHRLFDDFLQLALTAGFRS
ncbi:hypothetical protein V1VFAS_118 [Rhizobium phage V1VFA-S]|nr:hypothetical protein V1VFAS_118 [Rhizobium phage V1VFA-S]